MQEIGEKPELLWVPLDLIDVDHRYQRELRKALSSRIAKHFEWRKFGAVVLSRKEDGRFNVVEGQHRVEAARQHGGIVDVPAVVVVNDGRQGEADTFVAINRDRLAVTSIDQYWAGVEAGHPVAMAVKKVLDSTGCGVVPANGHYKPNLTNAVTAIDRCLKNYGEGPTRRAVLAIRKAWPNEEKALRGTLITAMARVIKANLKTIDDDEMSRSIENQSFAQMTASAEAFRKLGGGSAEAALSKTLVELYNRGKRTNVIYFGAGR